ncbi:hypothetical protein DRN67_01100 [Candidatus Micrarchaeota archaeon]|nr:MAG: hypothetical protein DRN67_01100 [Candidatus Micrarchaeota archaeon]
MKFPALLLLMLSLASLASASATQLETSSSLESPQIYGGAVLFTCTYSDASGAPIPEAKCSVIIDGRRNTATGQGADFTYGEILGVGRHSWYCSCSSPSTIAQESPPQVHIVLPSQSSSEVATAIMEAEEQLEAAKAMGLDTSDAELALEEAKAALEQGDFELANTLLSNEDLFSKEQESDRISDLGLLLIPMLLLGLLVLFVLLFILRK